MGARCFLAHPAQRLVVSPMFESLFLTCRHCISSPGKVGNKKPRAAICSPSWPGDARLDATRSRSGPYPSLARRANRTPKANTSALLFIFICSPPCSWTEIAPVNQYNTEYKAIRAACQKTRLGSALCWRIVSPVGERKKIEVRPSPRLPPLWAGLGNERRSRGRSYAQSIQVAHLSRWRPGDLQGT